MHYWDVLLLIKRKTEWAGCDVLPWLQLQQSNAWQQTLSQSLFQEIGAGKWCKSGSRGGCNFIHLPAWKAILAKIGPGSWCIKTVSSVTFQSREFLYSQGLLTKLTGTVRRYVKGKHWDCLCKEIYACSNQWGFLISWKLTINWRGCTETSIRSLNVSTHLLQFTQGTRKPDLLLNYKNKNKSIWKSRLSKPAGFGVGNKLTTI